MRSARKVVSVHGNLQDHAGLVERDERHVGAWHEDEPITVLDGVVLRQRLHGERMAQEGKSWQPWQCAGRGVGESGPALRAGASCRKRHRCRRCRPWNPLAHRRRWLTVAAGVRIRRIGLQGLVCQALRRLGIVGEEVSPRAVTTRGDARLGAPRAATSPRTASSPPPTITHRSAGSGSRG